MSEPATFDEPSFYEIGARSNFSFLEGAARPEEMVLVASVFGLSGIGLADRNSVAGVVRAHNQVVGMQESFRRQREKLEQEAAQKDEPAGNEGDGPIDVQAGEQAGGQAGEPKEEEDAILPCRFHPGARLCFADDTPDVLAYPINRKGWANLCRLLSRGNLRTEKGNCILEEWDFLEWCSEMMLAVVPDFSNLDDPAAVKEFEKKLVTYREKFGKSLYLQSLPPMTGAMPSSLQALLRFPRGPMCR